MRNETDLDLVEHLIESTETSVKFNRQTLCPTFDSFLLIINTYFLVSVFMHPFSAWTRQILRRRVRFLMTAATWLLSIASNIPYPLNTRLYRFSDTAAACGRTDTLRVWVTVSFVLWYILPLTVLALMYTNIGMMLWRSGSCVITVTRPSADSQSSAQTGVSWQMANGRTIVYKQDSLLQVPDDPQVKKRQRDLTESRRKVQYRPPALRYYDSATPAWVRCRVVVFAPMHVPFTLCYPPSS
ncbi:unnamed protein product [Nippostrongylus brasiliensis]|uniref:G_PROTEIN_RECEP_F1_2 domain-containing protein n=1 Tax=Nippostrongylus brasiliensis TaxID=27835 RepID=A0A0N4XH05_NIPBR|nr:unnamed protein product [Nippostrongylus brasiliensis]